MSEAYQALYRKWRPRTFNDVVGQTHITDTLKSQLQSGRLSHAYLFTGTRGTGKTTCAKLLARAVNCRNLKDGNPCNVCAACVGIENGSILDVTELDAASNNGVEQIRDLRDEAKYTPAEVKKRVYIVDEVHMLSVAAFNALLKIMEEPPEHLLFILATTELHKVPATILSRCQRFSFKRIRPEDIAQRLLEIAGEEGITLTPDGAALLARLSEGALRDALSLLDQCANLNRPVDQPLVLETLGLAGNIKIAHLMNHIKRRNAAEALTLLDELYTGGKDIKSILGELITLARDLLVLKTAPTAADALMTGGYDSKTLAALSKNLPPARLLQILNQLQETQNRLRLTAYPRLDGELCLISLCDETLDQSQGGLAARLARVEEQLLNGAVPAPFRTELPDQPPPPQDGDAPPEQETYRAAPVAPRQSSSALCSAVMDEAKRRLGNPPAIYLNNPKFTRTVIEGDHLTLYVNDPTARSVLEKPEVTTLLQELGSRQLGQTLTVSVKPGEAPMNSSGTENSYCLAPDDKLNQLLELGQDLGNMDIINR